MFTMEIQFYSFSVLLCFTHLLSSDKWNLAEELNYLFENVWQYMYSQWPKRAYHREKYTCERDVIIHAFV